MKRARFRVVLLLIGCTALVLTTFIFALYPLSSHLPPSPLSAVCTSSPLSPGGFDEPHPATPYIQLLVTQHRSAVLNALNLSSSTASLTALAWCQQVVAGTNYAVSVDVGQEREVVVINIFVAYWWFFPKAEADRLKKLRRVRSSLSRVGGTQLMQGDWAEHDEPPL